MAPTSPSGRMVCIHKSEYPHRNEVREALVTGFPSSATAAALKNVGGMVLLPAPLRPRSGSRASPDGTWPSQRR
jgi:hypothetical protein